MASWLIYALAPLQYGIICVVIQRSSRRNTWELPQFCSRNTALQLVIESSFEAQGYVAALEGLLIDSDWQCAKSFSLSSPNIDLTLSVLEAAKA